jgi:hypothetical protein
MAVLCCAVFSLSASLDVMWIWMAT